MWSPRVARGRGPASSSNRLQETYGCLPPEPALGALARLRSELSLTWRPCQSTRWRRSMDSLASRRRPERARSPRPRPSCGRTSPAWYADRRGWMSGRAVWESASTPTSSSRRATRRSGDAPARRLSSSATPTARQRTRSRPGRRACFRSAEQGRSARAHYAGCGTCSTSQMPASPSGPSTISVGRSSSRSTRGCSRRASSRAGTGVGATTWPPISPISPSCFESEPRAPRTASTPRSPRDLGAVEAFG